MIGAENPRSTASILGAAIDALDWRDAISRTRRWADKRESRYVRICNVHSVLTASRDTMLYAAIKQAAHPEGVTQAL